LLPMLPRGAPPPGRQPARPRSRLTARPAPGAVRALRPRVSAPPRPAVAGPEARLLQGVSRPAPARPERAPRQRFSCARRGAPLLGASRPGLGLP